MVRRECFKTRSQKKGIECSETQQGNKAHDTYSRPQWFRSARLHRLPGSSVEDTTHSPQQEPCATQCRLWKPKKLWHDMLAKSGLNSIVSLQHLGCTAARRAQSLLHPVLWLKSTSWKTHLQKKEKQFSARQVAKWSIYQMANLQTHGFFFFKLPKPGNKSWIFWMDILLM